MRFWTIFVIIFSLGALSIYGMVTNGSNPENMVIGQWNEVKWEYELYDRVESKTDGKSKIIPEDLKPYVGGDLKIHEAEMWKFEPNGKLTLTDRNGNKLKQLKWAFKGRGNVLYLKYDDNSIESYIVTTINQDKLVLNIDLHIGAKGLAKLTFEKF
ncbi:hypothetical protein [Peijinzhouia sedimentorum]